MDSPLTVPRLMAATRGRVIRARGSCCGTLFIGVEEKAGAEDATPWEHEDGGSRREMKADHRVRADWLVQALGLRVLEVDGLAICRGRGFSPAGTVSRANAVVSERRRGTG